MTDSTDIRLRFSPAPTGFLHVGSAHTALFNWAQARHRAGTFILRIEDTDVARSTDESIEQIQQVMRWLGLDWDEGPYLQSQRFDAYLAAAQRLLDAGVAYECFCTEAEVRERNEQAMREGRAPGYDGRCRDLTAEEREAFRAEGRGRSVRFRTPDSGRSTFVDLVRGEISVEWSTISDFVIVRSNGTPVFFLPTPWTTSKCASRMCCAARISSTRHTVCSRYGARSDTMTSPFTRICPSSSVRAAPNFRSVTVRFRSRSTAMPGISRTRS